jgi:hypothetical protein
MCKGGLLYFFSTFFNTAAFAAPRVLEDYIIEPRTVATFALAVTDALTTWLDPIPSRLDLIPTRLDLIPTRLDLLPIRLDLIPTRLDLISLG